MSKILFNSLNSKGTTKELKFVQRRIQWWYQKSQHIENAEMEVFNSKKLVSSTLKESIKYSLDRLYISVDVEFPHRDLDLYGVVKYSSQRQW